MRFGGLFNKARKDRELHEELESHIQMHTEDNLRSGMTPDEARRQAMIKFGGIESTKEAYREQRGLPLLETLGQDLRFGARMLRKNPGFTAAAVLTLALGIGANTAIFSLINAVLLKALPVKNPEDIVLLDWVSNGWPAGLLDGFEGTYTEKKGHSTSFSVPYFEQARTRNRVFSDMFAAAANAATFNVCYNGQADRANVALVSGSFFSTLGVQPVLGRAFSPDDDRLAASPTAVISYGYWKRGFGGEPGVIGRTIAVNGAPLTIIGVSPPEFFGIQPGRPVDVWLPLHARPQVEGPSKATLFTAQNTWWVVLMGRLKPGVTVEMARADLELIFQQNVASDLKPGTKEELIPHIDVQPGSNGLSELRNQFSQSLFILMAVVALVLLIACANVAGLLLARAASRQKEIAVRLAVGAGRSRLIRQFLTESILIASLGGAFGLILAYWGSPFITMALALGSDPVSLSANPDWRVFGFTGAISALTAILSGVSPALRSTRIDLAPAFKGAGEGFWDWTPSLQGIKIESGQALVALQVALSLVLLLGAGLFVRTLKNLETVNCGFNERNLLLFGIDPTADGYKGRRLADFYLELSRRVKLVPGIRSASVSQTTLISGGVIVTTLELEGCVPKPGEKDANVTPYVNWVGPEFFETLGIPVVLGRPPRETDRDGTPIVAVVNQEFVRKYLGDVNPVGRHLRSKSQGEIEIVGVVGDTKYDSLRNDAPPTLYLALLQDIEALGAAHYEVRTASNPMNFARSVRQLAQEMDPNLPLFDVTTQTNQINQRLSQERLFAWLTSLLGVLAGLLACVGIYGIVSFTVSRRTREIGVRMALGARKRHIFLMVIKHGMRITLVGLAAGLLLALAVTRLLRTFLFGVTPADPWTFGAVTLMLSGVVFVACWLPARRAGKVDPMVALRNE
jgi:predicted permease